MKVLACAYACNPYRGSEEGVGWGWVNTIARSHDVWVLTAEYHRDDIERATKNSKNAGGNLHFLYVSPKSWHYRPTAAWIRIENSIIKPIMNLAYRFWLRDAFVLGAQLHREIGFDIVHQITYVGFRFPGHLWKLHTPFVWGPIGGLENTPWRLLRTMGARGAVYYGARNIINSLHRRFLRVPPKAFAAAGLGVIAATSSIQNEIARWYGVSSQVICEVGISEHSAGKSLARGHSEPLKLSWSGQHLPGKALHLLLEALSGLPSSIDWRLDVYGDGPSRMGWQRLAKALGIDSQCNWIGQVPREEAVFGLQKSHLFVVTSLKDLTSTVILEALAHGVPVLCPNHCGFPDVIDDTCGIRLPIGTALEFKQALAKAIIKLAGDETMRRRLSVGALTRAPQFSWDAKAFAIEAVYRRVMESPESHSSLSPLTHLLDAAN
jgi:glycosyltransferase involved in cell wall biosynthesis